MATHDSNKQRQSAQEKTTTVMTVAPSPTSRSSQPAKGIGKVPVELMLTIAGHLGAAELASLALSCRGVNNLLTPLLYKHNVQEQNSSAVLWACEHNSIGTLERLREAGAKFDFEVEHPPRRRMEAPVRFCPIHVAAKHGHVDVLAWLLAHGARLDVLSQGLCDCRSFPYYTDRHRRERSPFPDPEWSALHLATCSGHTDAVICLVERGASPTVSQTTNDYVHATEHRQVATTNVTVLHTAAAANNVALIDYLVERDLVDLERYDHRGFPPFFYAAAGAHSVGALARIDQLLGGPVDYSYPPLQFALLRGAFACALYLLKAGYRHDFGFSLVPRAAEMTYSPQWNATSPSIWARQRDTFILELLARGHSAVPNESEWPMAGSTTVLHYLAEQPPASTTPSLFAALIAAGCPADTPDREGRTPLYLLADGLKDIPTPPDSDPDSAEARKSARETILLLLQHRNARLFTTSAPDQKTPLDALLGDEQRLPAWRQELVDEVLQFVLHDKCEHERQTQLLRQDLWPLLAECVEAGRVDACRVLLKHGARYRVIHDDAKVELVREALGLVTAVVADNSDYGDEEDLRWDGRRRERGRDTGVQVPVAKPEILEALACCVSAAEMRELVWQAKNMEVKRVSRRNCEWVDGRWVWEGRESVRWEGQLCHLG